MKIAYITNVRLPSERAHGHQVARVCDALASLGHSVTVFAPYRNNPIREDFRTYHHIKHNVVIKHLGSFDPINRWWLPGPLGLWALNLLFRGALLQELRRDNSDLLYTRSPALLPALIALQIPIVLELHAIPNRNKATFVKLCNMCVRIVCLTSAMRDDLCAMGVAPERVMVEGDAVDLEAFDALAKNDLSLSIPHEAALLVYAGQLRSMGLSKGVEELLGALTILVKKQVPFHAVIAGGPESAKEEFAAGLPADVWPHITFTGHLPHEQIPALLKKADVLVYPAPKPSHTFHMRDTSPLKLFEYMAAAKPIVCADLPPLHDVLSDEMVMFVEPGSAQALATGIEHVLHNPQNAAKKAERARAVVQEHTWEKRMKRILDFATLQS